MSKEKIVRTQMSAGCARVWRKFQRVAKKDPDRASMLLALLEALYQCSGQRRAVQMSAFLGDVAGHIPWMMPNAVDVAERAMRRAA